MSLLSHFIEKHRKKFDNFTEAKTSIEQNYSQLGELEGLFIKYYKKEECTMPEIKIISDIENKIAYDKVEHCELDRDAVVLHRERLEALKLQRADIEKEIAELELVVAGEEEIVKLADEKKAIDEENSVVEEVAPVEEANNEVEFNN